MYIIHELFYQYVDIGFIRKLIIGDFYSISYSYDNIQLYIYIPNMSNSHLTLQHLTVLSTEFFRQHKTHIPSVIYLSTKSLTEMLRQ